MMKSIQALSQELANTRLAAPMGRVWISEPTWPNHPGIGEAIGMPVWRYGYYDRATGQVAFEAMVDAASTLDDETRRETLAREGNLLMLQAREHLVGPELDMVEARYQRFLQDIER